MSIAMPEVQISALNHYCYCPKRAFICYISQEFIDNEYTIHGKEVHNRVDSGVITKRRDLYQIRSVWLRSDKYGLTGKADLIEEKAGEIYPVEYKRGKSKDWKNDQVQLTAQALCLEEMLQLKAPISKGFIFYHLSNFREEVELNEELRKETIKIISEFRQLLITERKPVIPFNPKCPNCSVYPVCLPKEVEKLKEINLSKLIFTTD
jgi:CRISPR-associated exonuclease Cas4